MQCRATADTTGKQCRRNACTGSSYCVYHGKRSSPHVLNAKFITGRHSESLMGGLVASYAATLSDKELLSMRDDIALIDANINYLLKRQKTDAESLESLVDGNPKVYDKKKAAVERRAAADTTTLIDLLEQRRKLVETEMKRRTLAQTLVPVEQAMAVIGKIVDIITNNVVDKPTLRNIVRDLDELLASAGAPGPVRVDSRFAD